MAAQQNNKNTNKVDVVLGSQWGDEGKGKLVDLLAEHADVVARCQGGGNAGHTVVVGDKAYDFHLLPSGIIWQDCISIIGNGVVIHCPNLFEELAKNEEKGLTGWGQRLKISDRAHLVFDFHQAADAMQEKERSSTKEQIGTTKKGIGPTYSSKANRSGVRVSDLVGNFEYFEKRFTQLAKSYEKMFPGLEVDIEAEMQRYKVFAQKLKPMVTETISLLNKMVNENKKILIEGANATMLDIDFGTYPFVTSCNCSIGAVCTGLGICPKLIGNVYGVVKAYTTRVGPGPFPTEQINEKGEFLRTEGHEFGTTTGRPRRCGWLDIPLLRHTHMVNGFDAIAITKLDILDTLDEIPIGINYIKNGEKMTNYPTSEHDHEGLTVEYLTMPGWKTSLAKCNKFDSLPINAQKYVLKIEELLGIPVKWIGVGKSRSAIILR